ncbi:MAG: hypothetical protein AAB800_02885 [Patescibacteria group bacterium]
MTNESFQAGDGAFQEWTARLNRAAYAGCVTLAIASMIGGSVAIGTFQMMKSLGVHIEPGFAPLSLTFEIVSPCATMVSGRETTERWRHVSVRRTVGFNPQARDWWSAADEDIGYEICK